MASEKGRYLKNRKPKKLLGDYGEERSRSLKYSHARPRHI